MMLLLEGWSRILISFGLFIFTMLLLAGASAHVLCWYERLPLVVLAMVTLIGAIIAILPVALTLL